MAGLKRSLKCEDLLTMAITTTKDCQSRSSCSIGKKNESLLLAQFIQLRTGPTKRQRFAAHSKTNPATAALECLESSWDHAFQTAVAMN
jgi:hypothetical protein